MFSTKIVDFNSNHSYTSLRVVDFIFLDETHNEIQIMRCDQHVSWDGLVVVVVRHLNSCLFPAFYLRNIVALWISPANCIEIKIIGLRFVEVERFYASSKNWIFIFVDFESNLQLGNRVQRIQIFLSYQRSLFNDAKRLNVLKRADFYVILFNARRMRRSTRAIKVKLQPVPS
jgi:hypothetical protein